MIWLELQMAGIGAISVKSPLADLVLGIIRTAMRKEDGEEARMLLGVFSGLIYGYALTVADRDETARLLRDALGGEQSLAATLATAQELLAEYSFTREDPATRGRK